MYSTRIGGATITVTPALAEENQGKYQWVGVRHVNGHHAQHWLEYAEAFYLLDWLRMA